MSDKRNGKNIWVSAETGENVVAETKPQGRDWDEWYAAYNPRRVTGSTYEPYQDNSPWAQSANHSMSREANNNFRNGRR